MTQATMDDIGLRVDSKHGSSIRNARDVKQFLKNCVREHSFKKPYTLYPDPALPTKHVRKVVIAISFDK